MQSGVRTRRMIVTTDEQGFISAIYKEKTHGSLFIKWTLRVLSCMEGLKKRFMCVNLQGLNTLTILIRSRRWRKLSMVCIKLQEPDGDDVDVHLYRSMIGSLMYLTSSRPDIIFIFWRTASVRTLENREIKLNATVDGQVKTITKASVKRHLKLADANVLTQNVFRNIKRESMGFFGVEAALFPTMLVTKQVFQGEGPTSPVGTQHTPTIIESSPHLQNVSITYRKTRTKTGRMVIRIPQSNVASSATDEAITKEMHDGLGMATATASSLAAEQGSGNISKTQTKATPSGLSSPRTSLEGSLGCHFTTRDSPVQASPVQASPERLFDLPNEPPLGEGNTS
nr:hypothetical protein [Tanacetum cinerariifolium]